MRADVCEVDLTSRLLQQLEKEEERVATQRAAEVRARSAIRRGVYWWPSCHTLLGSSIPRYSLCSTNPKLSCFSVGPGFAVSGAVVAIRDGAIAQGETRGGCGYWGMCGGLVLLPHGGRGSA